MDEVKIVLPSLSSNESYARIAVGAFVSKFDPTVEELCDIKTAVSEAVTNCIVHAYQKATGKIYISVSEKNGVLTVKVRDKGCGIPDIEKAMQPLFTTGGEERAGLGFAVMQTFTDKLRVVSKPGKGTTVIMRKALSKKDAKK